MAVKQFSGIKLIPIFFCLFLLTGCASFSAAGAFCDNSNLPDLLSAVLRIEVPIIDQASGKEIYKSGTGFFFYNTSYIVTCAHNLRETESSGKEYTIYYQKKSFTAHLVDKNSEQDLALLECFDAGNPFFFDSVRMPNQGCQVLGAGYPIHIPGFTGLYVSSGVVSTDSSVPVELQGITKEYFVSDLFAARGMSGGPVFSLQGTLIGIIQAVFTDKNDSHKGFTFFLSAPVLEAYVKDTIKKQKEMLPASTPDRKNSIKGKESGK